jgi:hypothetical protein
LEDQYAQMALMYPHGLASLGPLPEEVSGEVWSYFNQIASEVCAEDAVIDSSKELQVA